MNTSFQNFEVLPDNLIIDEFFCDEFFVAVLNNDLLKYPNTLLLAKILIDGTKKVLVSLTDEEYERAINKYNQLKILFEGEN